jgi:hypothetical protein
VSATNHRLDLLEQKVEVLMAEINTALREMQVTMEAMARVQRAALASLDARITTLEGSATPTPATDSHTRPGKEL